MTTYIGARPIDWIDHDPDVQCRMRARDDEGLSLDLALLSNDAEQLELILQVFDHIVLDVFVDVCDLVSVTISLDTLDAHLGVPSHDVGCTCSASQDLLEDRADVVRVQVDPIVSRLCRHDVLLLYPFGVGYNRPRKGMCQGFTPQS